MRGAAIIATRTFATLATLVAAAALGAVVAYWGWQVIAPAVVRIPPTGPSNPAATLLAANLFGAAGAVAPAPLSPGAVLGSDARLLGLIAGRGDASYALFRLPDGPRLVASGAQIAAGVTLVSVQPDAVTIRDSGGERRLVLRADRIDRTSPPVVAASTPTAAASAPSRPATCAPPKGFQGSVVRLNTELLGGIGADASQWRTLLAPIDGGLVVRADGGFAAMLGLRSGDRLTQANGIALMAPDDVDTVIVRPLAANQGVRLIGARDGATRELWLANVACAG
jgi:hypothetical protein